ncbi:hypothetical protein [Streptomyces sp. NPDC053048]|uniref:hypothetical protein n=1 Tax=Streptomyces sp. NPDC053048 TaxID=3365694 RepID=UPI0037CF25D2
MPRPSLRRAAALTAIAAALGLGLAAPAEAGPGPIPPLTAHERALLGSTVPKTVELDPATGRILSVKESESKSVKESGAPVQAIGRHNYCDASDGCFYSGRTPYAHQGFYGSPGTSHGDWPYRSGYYTGKYKAKPCWAQACTEIPLPPRTYADFRGALVTGKSFRIY